MSGPGRVFLAIYSVLFIVGALGVAALAWNDSQKLDLSIGDLNLQAFFLTDGATVERLVLTVFLLLLIGLGVWTLTLALRSESAPGAARGVLRLQQEGGGSIEVQADAIEGLLANELMRLPEVRQATARVRVNGAAVAPAITLGVEPTANVATITDQAAAHVRNVLRTQFGVTNVQGPTVRVQHAQAAAQPAPAAAPPASPGPGPTAARPDPFRSAAPPQATPPAGPPPSAQPTPAAQRVDPFRPSTPPAGGPPSSQPEPSAPRVDPFQQQATAPRVDPFQQQPTAPRPEPAQQQATAPRVDPFQQQPTAPRAEPAARPAAQPPSQQPAARTDPFRPAAAPTGNENAPVAAPSPMPAPVREDPFQAPHTPALTGAPPAGSPPAQPDAWSSDPFATRPAVPRVADENEAAQTRAIPSPGWSPPADEPTMVMSERQPPAADDDPGATAFIRREIPAAEEGSATVHLSRPGVPAAEGDDAAATAFIQREQPVPAPGAFDEPPTQTVAPGQRPPEPEAARFEESATMVMPNREAAPAEDAPAPFEEAATMVRPAEPQTAPAAFDGSATVMRPRPDFPPPEQPAPEADDQATVVQPRPGFAPQTTPPAEDATAILRREDVMPPAADPTEVRPLPGSGQGDATTTFLRREDVMPPVAEPPRAPEPAAPSEGQWDEQATVVQPRPTPAEGQPGGSESVTAFVQRETMPPAPPANDEQATVIRPTPAVPAPPPHPGGEQGTPEAAGEPPSDPDATQGLPLRRQSEDHD